MALIKCKKYQISLDPNSNKVQGLAVGDIVRRQYFDGKNTIYSLMLVTKTGVNTILVDEEEKEQNFFQGYLLAGDPIVSGEIMDFARITNLFDEERLGLLYFTASDSFAPYMDLIDGIGKNSSLCWPESMSLSGNFDSSKQYVTFGNVVGEYNKEYEYNKRVCHLTFTSNNQKAGLIQDFYQYIQNPNRVIVSYKIKATKNLSGTVTLGYQDGSRIDGNDLIEVSTEWQYKTHIIGVDWSGRHLRSVTLDLGSECNEGDEVWIADFNIILQSSVEDFSSGSQARIGKLDGVSDPVFGRLKGYGSYLHKLYATQGAHVSGTLTAGDENGFGGTFYAGKIVRNEFTNSISVQWSPLLLNTEEVINPVGLGNVYRLPDSVTCYAQSSEWGVNHIGETYTVSMWLYPKNTGTHTLFLDDIVVGVFEFEPEDLFVWQRYSATFKIPNKTFSAGLHFTHKTVFDEISDNTGKDTSNDIFYVAPQLEKGNVTTQYQATDDVILNSGEYGAWFCRGGIGGTMQNPLLKLNFDGDGSIGSRNNSFVIKQDGSGHLANENIRWSSSGDVTFGPGVKLGWDNIDSESQEMIKPKNINLSGNSQFDVVTNDITGESTYTPDQLLITLQSNGFDIAEATKIEWGYINSSGIYNVLQNESQKQIQILPTGEYWDDSNSFTLQCTVTINQIKYSDTIHIKKEYLKGYQVSIKSSAGQFFVDGKCATRLEAIVSYNGKVISEDNYESMFEFYWTKIVDGSEDESWESPPTSQSFVVVDEILDTRVTYNCLVYLKE
mgnify:CR=1 FL=1|jgi:hypothetical protein